MIVVGYFLVFLLCGIILGQELVADVAPDVRIDGGFENGGNLVVHYHESSVQEEVNPKLALEELEIQRRYVIASIYNETIHSFDNSEVIVDVNGGNCVSADKLGIMLQKTVWCLEPYQAVNTSDLTRAVYIRIDGSSFTSKATLRYNFIVLKDVTNHLQYSLIFGNIYKQLLSKGALVIIARPQTPSFLFTRQLRERWAATSVKLEKVIPQLELTGYRVSTQAHNFTVSATKEEWKKFLLDHTRFTFDTFPEEDVQRELREIDRVYSKDFALTDNCVFIIARKG